VAAITKKISEWLALISLLLSAVECGLAWAESPFFALLKRSWKLVLRLFESIWAYHEERFIHTAARFLKGPNAL
jgi:hypothetical protein